MERYRIIGMITVAILIVYSIVSIAIGPSKTLLRENLEKQQFQGIIQKKMIDTNDHFGNKIIINGLKQPIHWDLAAEIAEGDSVIKLKGKTFITVYKQNGQSFKYDLVNNKKYY